jgi:hypothetical protein
MADRDPTRNRPEDPSSEDRRTERAVLAFLLDQHPIRLRADELPFALDAKDFAEKDAVLRAARDLLSVGLLVQDGKLIGPSRAALHFDYLESE